MIYEYKCDKCDKVWTRVRAVKNRDDNVVCNECRGSCKRIVSVPMRGQGGPTPIFNRR